MTLISVARSPAARALSLLRAIQASPPTCPSHSSAACSQGAHGHGGAAALGPILHRLATSSAGPDTDYAFEMASSTIRFGPGCAAEVGMDVDAVAVPDAIRRRRHRRGSASEKRVLVVTDPTVARLPVMTDVVLPALEREARRPGTSVGRVDLFDRVAIEPTDGSVRAAIAAAAAVDPDVIVAVGGGSVIDTAKMANLYVSDPDVATATAVLRLAAGTGPGPDLLDYVPAPVGRGRLVAHAVRPLIAVPTTAGTGSETTGTAIFDLRARHIKTGVASRALRPALGLCDPASSATMPAPVRASTGLDVLCHALESWTAIPYTARTPRPASPAARPAYQGANPVSDIFALHALRATVKYLPRSVRDPDDAEANEQMLLAATLAGIGFGNAGVHLCHALSYPLSGAVAAMGEAGAAGAAGAAAPAPYHHPSYPADKPLLPHGVAVALTAPAVFRFTAAADPDRHRTAAEQAFGVDLRARARPVRDEDVGELLADELTGFLDRLGGQPMGLAGVGLSGPAGASADVIERLVDGAMPQSRVLKLAPRFSAEREVDEQRAILRSIFEQSVSY